MQDPADRLASAIRALLRERFERDPAVRELAAALASLIIDEAERIEPRHAPLADDHEPDQPAEKPAPPPAPHAEQATEEAPRGVVPLRIGGNDVPIEVRGAEHEIHAAKRSAEPPSPPPEQPDANGTPKPEPDIRLIATRARLKAESCRFYIDRRAAEGDPDREPPLVERMNAMIDEAQSHPDCFLWVFWKREVQPSDERLRVIADCYDALADAAELCHEIFDPDAPCSPAEREDALTRFAEASSALRVSLGWTWLSKPDSDQNDSHDWLRTVAFERGIFIPRHMKLGDPADPGRAPALRQEIAELRDALTERRKRGKRIEELFNKARFHADRLPESGTAGEHDCTRINEVVAELERLAVSPADTRFDELRKMISPDAFPPDLPPHHLLLRAPAGSRDAPTNGNQPTPRAWSDRVMEARRLLGAGGVVIIGGEPRPDAIERIRDAFALRGVNWVPLSEHGSGGPMRAPIARPETAAVFILIKLCGHLHAEEARQYAREAGKPVINLPAGYNPEQIAEQLLAQAADRLA